MSCNLAADTLYAEVVYVVVVVVVVVVAAAVARVSEVNMLEGIGY